MAESLDFPTLNPKSTDSFGEPGDLAGCKKGLELRVESKETRVKVRGLGTCMNM